MLHRQLRKRETLFISPRRDMTRVACRLSSVHALSIAGQVRFGLPNTAAETGAGVTAGHWVVKTGVDGSLRCRADSFGSIDPTPGKPKVCQCQAEDKGSQLQGKGYRR